MTDSRQARPVVRPVVRPSPAGPPASDRLPPVPVQFRGRSQLYASGGPLAVAAAFRRMYLAQPCPVVVLMAPAYLVFDSGEVVHVGSDLSISPFVGCVLDAVDVREGTATLVGGLVPGGRAVLRCGIMWSPPGVPPGRGFSGSGSGGRSAWRAGVVRGPATAPADDRSDSRLAADLHSG